MNEKRLRVGTSSWSHDSWKPDGFMFSAKVPSIIMHEKRLVGCDAELKEFLRVMDLLGA